MNLVTRRAKLRTFKTMQSRAPVIHHTRPGTRVTMAITAPMLSLEAEGVEAGEVTIEASTTAGGGAGEEEATGLIIMEVMGMGVDIIMDTEGGSNDVMIVCTLMLNVCLFQKIHSSVHDNKDTSSAWYEQSVLAVQSENVRATIFTIRTGLTSLEYPQNITAQMQTQTVRTGKL